MRKFLFSLFLFCFTFGVAVMTKYFGVAQWIENNPMVSIPMMIFGAVGLSIFFVGDD